MIQIAVFEILPTDDIYPLIFDFELKEEKPLNDQWEACDFATNVFIMNMGSPFLVFLYLIFRCIMLGLSKLACCANTKCLRKIGDFFSKDLLWNPIIEYLAMNYMAISFSVIL